ncbi:uncharacterized protein BJ171DRAFT_583071 [Polychytrium aggregatum]|uniref:uncharacterized protein n=1 Tax=Polychytrium aggregatum TaxID=110093 RepID=UPI0022FEB4E2|nr:uncharacterized protein BJ171DRAFT_583071 [Polychytrium aggregatum]KAI9203238.1 hypothetical protein BJ171DRAFT_583071 [Polychytrium aggregatum]
MSPSFATLVRWVSLALALSLCPATLGQQIIATYNFETCSNSSTATSFNVYNQASFLTVTGLSQSTLSALCRQADSSFCVSLPTTGANLGLACYNSVPDLSNFASHLDPTKDILVTALVNGSTTPSVNGLLTGALSGVLVGTPIGSCMASTSAGTTVYTSTSIMQNSSVSVLATGTCTDQTCSSCNYPSATLAPSSSLIPFNTIQTGSLSGSNAVTDSAFELHVGHGANIYQTVFNGNMTLSPSDLPILTVAPRPSFTLPAIYIVASQFITQNCSTTAIADQVIAFRASYGASQGWFQSLSDFNDKCDDGANYCQTLNGVSSHISCITDPTHIDLALNPALDLVTYTQAPNWNTSTAIDVLNGNALLTVTNINTCFQNSIQNPPVYNQLSISYDQTDLIMSTCSDNACMNCTTNYLPLSTQMQSNAKSTMLGYIQNSVGLWNGYFLAAVTQLGLNDPLFYTYFQNSLAWQNVFTLYQWAIRGVLQQLSNA